MTAALATEILPAAVPYSPTRFDAFRIADMGKGNPQRTYKVDIEGYLLPTVEAARDAALLGQAFAHKDHLIIRETGERGVKLHVFAIKRKSTPTYVWEGHVQKRVNRLYADPVCTIDGGVLAL